MGLVLVVGGTTAFAAEPGRGCYSVDMDGDGGCDNYAVGQGCGSQGGRGR